MSETMDGKPFQSELKRITEEKERELEALQRSYIARQLNELTAEQLEFFNKIYPDGVPVHQLLNAGSQIERTIIKNQKAKNG